MVHVSCCARATWLQNEPIRMPAHLSAVQDGLVDHPGLLVDAAAAAHEGLDDAVHEHERVEIRAVGELQAPAWDQQVESDLVLCDSGT